MGSEILLKFEDIILENYSGYPEEIQEYMKSYSDILREELKAELIKNKADRMLTDIEKSNETFIKVLSEILENGTRGYNKMTTQTLIDMYLDVKNQEDFIALLEKINDEI